MPVRVKFIDGVRPLDLARAKAWLRQGAVPRPGWTTDEHLRLFVQNWTASYGFLQQAEFVRHFVEYAEQYELFAGIRDIVDDIVKRFPPQVYQYVGIGRSPAPIIAVLENERFSAFTIPLSDFRPRHLHSSITDRVLPDPRLSAAQSDGVAAHFRRYLGRMMRRNVLLIDYGQTARSLVAAQEQLQCLFNGEPQHSHREVHALALCRAGVDAAMAAAVATTIGEVSWRQPFDRLMNAAARQEFVRRWNVMSIVKQVGMGTHRQILVERALSGERFDKLAEYASFKILDAGAPGAAVRHQAPGGTTAYEVLRDELKSVR